MSETIRVVLEDGGTSSDVDQPNESPRATTKETGVSQPTIDPTTNQPGGSSGPSAQPPQPREEQAPATNVDGSIHGDEVERDTEDIVDAIKEGFEGVEYDPDFDLDEIRKKLALPKPFEGNGPGPDSEEESSEDGKPADDKPAVRFGDHLQRAFERMEKAGILRRGQGKRFGEQASNMANGFSDLFSNSPFGRKLLSIGAKGRAGATAAAGGVGRMLGFGASTAAAGGATAAGGVAAGSGAAAALALAVPPLLVLAIVVAGAVVAFRSLLGVYRRQADELEQYSGAIAGARAAVRAEEIASKIDRGQKIGEQIAQVEGARGRFNDAYYDLMTEIHQELAKLAPIAEVGIDYATASVRSLEVVVNILQAMLELANGDVGGVFRETREALIANEKFVSALRDIFGEDFNAGRNPGVDAILNHDPLAQPPLRPNMANPGI